MKFGVIFYGTSEILRCGISTTDGMYHKIEIMNRRLL